jgi:hypothetical protein
VGTWQHTVEILPREYKCSYCDKEVGSNRGYNNTGSGHPGIWLCPHGHPTFFDSEGNQYPSPVFGRRVDNIPAKEVNDLYEEARRCMSVQAYTSAVLACRKLLMNIAVDKSAPAGKSFMEYVDYLATNNYIPPDGKEWVDHIREKGNEATHEILLMSREDAEALIEFTEMLLKFVYEFPAKVKSRRPSP